MMRANADKGQSALEYLMTYGWAILVIIGAGVAMWQLGYLGQGPPITPGRQGFEEVTPVDWYVAADWAATDVRGARSIIRFKNDARFRILLQNMSLQIETPQEIQCYSGTYAAREMPPGGHFTVEFYMNGEQEDSCDGLLSGRPGEYYRARLSVEYLNMQSGLPHQSIGEIWGPLEHGLET